MISSSYKYHSDSCFCAYIIFDLLMQKKNDYLSFKSFLDIQFSKISIPLFNYFLTTSYYIVLVHVLMTYAFPNNSCDKQKYRRITQWNIKQLRFLTHIFVINKEVSIK